MLWSEIKKAYPNQWLIIEALEAHTTQTHQRKLERLAVIETCSDGSAAINRYRELHQEYPGREFYFVHTSRGDIEITERHWHGIRRSNEAVSQG